MSTGWLRRAKAPLTLCSSALRLLPGCGMGLSPSAPTTGICSDLRGDSSQGFHWSVQGFGPNDILNSDERQSVLTAIFQVGHSQTLGIYVGTWSTTDKCFATLASVVWRVTDPSVLRLTSIQARRSATLVGLRPGDTGVFADLTSNDGSFGVRVGPWSFTRAGHRDVTVARVVP
jgi:hypothetical protein